MEWILSYSPPFGNCTSPTDSQSQHCMHMHMQRETDPRNPSASLFLTISASSEVRGEPEPEPSRSSSQNDSHLLTAPISHPSLLNLNPTLTHNNLNYSQFANRTLIISFFCRSHKLPKSRNHDIL
jgi:hypothetical protein